MSRKSHPMDFQVFWVFLILKFFYYCKHILFFCYSKKNMTTIFDLAVKAIMLRFVTKRYGGFIKRFWFYLVPTIIAWHRLVRPTAPTPVGLLNKKRPLATSVVSKQSLVSTAMSFSRLTDVFASGDWFIRKLSLFLWDLFLPKRT